MFSEAVKDFIQEAKEHASRTCQDMEEGLGLTSHYVDVQLSPREISRSGKSATKFLEKELVILGDTDRKKSLLGPRQVGVPTFTECCINTVHYFINTAKFNTNHVFLSDL